LIYHLIDADLKNLQLPDYFKDVYKKLFGEAPSDAFITHSRRELMHAVLALIFNPSLAKAYFKGTKVGCVDGKTRRIFL
jgi:hypothetical protein